MTNSLSNHNDLALVSQPEVLKLFGVSPMTLWRWRKGKNFPREVRIQHRIFFRRTEIARFIEDHT
ncbi:unnamed protein product, partial [Laminaria digitata]